MKLHARLLPCAAALLVTAGTAFGDVAISSHTKTVEVKDDAWGIVAFRMEIPDNWTFEGALLRDPYCGGQPTVAYRVSSPDGLAGYQSLPAFLSYWSDDPSYIANYRKFHCKTMPSLSPAEFLAYIAPAIRPNPTIGEIRPTTDAAQIDEAISQYNARSREAHLPGTESGGGVRAMLEYTFHGQPVEENLRVVMQTYVTPIGIVGGARHQAWNSWVNVSGIRAPKGHLQEVASKLGPLVGKAVFTNEWIARQQQKMAADQKRAMETIKAMGDATSAMLKRNHDAYMKQSKESFERSQKLDREHQQAMHNSAVAWTLYAGDEQLVKNPQTGEISRITSRGGTNAHQEEGSGYIVVSDDPNFDPQYYLRGTWTQLENVNPLDAR